MAESKAKVITVYDEEHTTREETPSSASGFIKQRTRWNQGFIQIFLQGEWLSFPKFSQKITALYVLLSPVFQLILLLYTPFALWIAFNQDLQIVLSLYSFIPFYLLMMQIAVYMIGLFEFTRAYKLKYPFWMPLKILLTFYPYQLMLALSSLRAVSRMLTSNNSWEKTKHLNAHRISRQRLDPISRLATI